MSERKAISTAALAGTASAKSKGKKRGSEFIQDQAVQEPDCMVVVRRPSKAGAKRSRKAKPVKDVIAIDDDDDEDEGDYNNEQGQDDEDYTPENDHEYQDDDDDEEDEDDEYYDDHDEDEEQEYEHPQEKETVIQAITPLNSISQSKKRGKVQNNQPQQTRPKPKPKAKSKPKAKAPSSPPPPEHVNASISSFFKAPAKAPTKRPPTPIIPTKTRVQIHGSESIPELGLPKPNLPPPSPTAGMTQSETAASKTPEEIRREAMQLVRQLSTCSSSSSASSGENGRRQYSRQQSQDLSRGMLHINQFYLICM